MEAPRSIRTQTFQQAAALAKRRHHGGFPSVSRCSPPWSVSRFSGALIVTDIVPKSAWASGWRSCPIHRVG